jgi:HPt (histidine-containing phosphotransfer) domain-containing protein
MVNLSVIEKLQNKISSQFVMKIIRIFIEQLDEFTELPPSTPLISLQKKAHSLKSSCALLGFTELSQLFHKLECSSLNNLSPEDLFYLKIKIKGLIVQTLLELMEVEFKE